jgi:sphingomyelin phosphodiesterase acid-like 3
MKKVWKIGKLCVMARGCALATVFLGLAALAPARAAGENGAKTIQALFVSDIHFEPFLDPEKAVKLATAPVGEWNAILAAPASADAAARWAKVEQACPTRGADTSFALYQSSLRAIHVQAGDAKFVIVSGDLIAHSFSCKFAAVFPKAAPADLRAFVEKTIAYVLAELRAALPGVPVYAALGNNDSDCGDYQLDANSAFLKESAENFAADLRGPEQAQARETFAAGGYYSVSLPGRLVYVGEVSDLRRQGGCCARGSANRLAKAAVGRGAREEGEGLGDGAHSARSGFILDGEEMAGPVRGRPAEDVSRLRGAAGNPG